MNKPNYFLALLLVAVTLSSCAPDPRNAAEAYATILQADQDAADRIQARQQKDLEFQVYRDRVQALADEWVRAGEKFIFWFTIIGTIAAGFALLSTSAGYSWAVVSAGRAIARAADLRNNLIPLDPRTHQYPLMVSRFEQGLLTLHNPNTGGTVKLNLKNTPDRQMIAAMSMVQVTGELINGAKNANPEALAYIQPSAIGYDDGKVRIGKMVFDVAQDLKPAIASVFGGSAVEVLDEVEISDSE